MSAPGLIRTRRGRLLDLLASRCEHIPTGAEGRAAFTVGVPRLGVADKGVERVTAVGHLGGAVAPRGRAQQRRRRATGRVGGAVRGYRRPRLCAGARAGRLRADVGLEEVEGLAIPVDQDLAETTALDGNGRRPR